MAERIEHMEYVTPSTASTVEGEETALFLTGPVEFLCKQIALELAATTVWETIFGEAIDSYKRMDYAIRNFPALRIYSDRYRKDSESWFINGDITLDIIWPPNLRRRELEQFPDTVSAALLQQFRRPSFFTDLCEVVPGLNELGKVFSADKSLAFQWGEGEEIAPLTEIRINFRLDLRAWDDYLERDYRTKDEPFTRTLEDLEQIVADIKGLNDDESVNVTMQLDQTIEHED